MGKVLCMILSYTLQVLEIKAPSFSCYFFPDIIHEWEGWWIVSRVSHITSQAYSPNTTPLGYNHLEEQNDRTKGYASYYLLKCFIWYCVWYCKKISSKHSEKENWLILRIEEKFLPFLECEEIHSISSDILDSHWHKNNSNCDQSMQQGTFLA